MELRHLRYFITVAKELNVTRAASILHISQPALSRQIRDLEVELGVKFFERSANSLKLTEPGKVFLQESCAILRRVEAAVEKVSQKNSSKNSIVRVGYAASPTVEILSKAMHAFQQLHPNIAVDLKEMTSQQIVKGLKENKLDIALTVSISPQSFDGLAVVEIGAYKVKVACRKSHRFARMRSVLLSEVAEERLVTFSRDEHPESHEGLRKILSPYTDDPHIVMECDGASSLIAAVEAGKGVALVFQTLSRVAGNRVILKSLNPCPPLLPIAVVYPRSRLTAAASKFLEAIKSVKTNPARRSGAVLNV